MVYIAYKEGAHKKEIDISGGTHFQSNIAGSATYNNQGANVGGSKL